MARTTLTVRRTWKMMMAMARVRKGAKGMTKEGATGTRTTQMTAKGVATRTKTTMTTSVSQMRTMTGTPCPS